MSILKVVEIIRPLESGATRPFQCRLEDDNLYAVKGKAAQPDGLLAEVYSGHLGKVIGLPIPGFTLAAVKRNLLDSYEDQTVRSALGVETLFASLWQEPIEELKRPTLATLPRLQLAALYVFDHWIGNGDRSLSEHGGNANLFVRLADKSLVVIDHNLAFMSSYSPSELAVHACRDAWLDVSGDLVFKGELERRMGVAVRTLAALEADLPEDWLAAAPHFPTQAKMMLERFRSARFWDQLG